MSKVFDFFFGICSLIGLIVTIFVLKSSLEQVELITKSDQAYKELATIYRILGGSVVSLIFLFLCQSYIYNKHIAKLQVESGRLPFENKKLRQQIAVLERINSSTTESFHTITHTYRHIYMSLRESIITLKKKDKNLNEIECEKICGEFENFIVSLLANVNITLNLLTNDECASCIKIINKGKVKTLYRDPISKRRREKSDFKQNGELFVYNIEENYAFKLITDEKTKETFFVCNDLSIHDRYPACNANPEWNNLYNATIVVPIQANYSKNKNMKKMNVLGFLCCDNMKGNFKTKEVKDFLSSIGDLLYNLFFLYDRFALLTKEEGFFRNEKLQQYDYWDDNR